MDFSGDYRIPAPVPRVWEALNDAEVLQACIPGCRELQRTSDTGFMAVVATKVGPISALFKGRVTLSDLNPPHGYTLTGEGQGGAAGFARMSAQVALAEDGDATLLRYAAQAEIGGKLASVGSRLVQSVAKKNADDFFSAFAARLGGAAVAPPAAEAAMAGVEAADASQAPGTPAVAMRAAPAPSAGLPVWVIALIAGGCGVVLGFVLGRL
jgi:carbon monoxide dehydrogenase subunit G